MGLAGRKRPAWLVPVLAKQRGTSYPSPFCCGTVSMMRVNLLVLQLGRLKRRAISRAALKNPAARSGGQEESPPGNVDHLDSPLKGSKNNQIIQSEAVLPRALAALFVSVCP